LTIAVSQLLRGSRAPLLRIGAAGVVLIISTSTPALLSGSVDVNTIVQRWLAASRADFSAGMRFGYCERIRDDDGTKTYEVILLDGSPLKRLVRVDGRPLDADESEKERRRFEEEKEKRANESPHERADRIADYTKDFDRAHRILDQLPRAFEYTLQGTRKTGAYTVYVLQAVPRQDYQPPSTEAEVLTGMRGQFWIDTKSFRMIRGVARVLKPVTIAGFLATVEPGTEFELEQMRVEPDLWLPAHLQIRSHSRIVFFFHHHIHEDLTFFNYTRQSSRARTRAGTHHESECVA
jgi:hypothetical protein